MATDQRDAAVAHCLMRDPIAGLRWSVAIVHRESFVCRIGSSPPDAAAIVAERRGEIRMIGVTLALTALAMPLAGPGPDGRTGIPEWLAGRWCGADGPLAYGRRAMR